MEVKFAKSFNEKVERVIKDEQAVEKLYKTLQNFQQNCNVTKLVQDLRKVVNEPKRIPLFNEIRRLIPTKHQIEYDRLAPKLDLEKMRIVRLSRQNNEDMGFSVRGGLEHEVGIYVSDVESESPAHIQGLMAGDEIVRLNGFTVNQAIHQEALNLIKARNELILKVRNIGMIPVKDKPYDRVTWKYVDVEPNCRGTLSVNKHSNGSALYGEQINLFVNIPLGAGLGCSISGGPAHLPGIFIQSVKLGGIAQEAGLEVGDQVLRVNDTKFDNVTHSEAIVAFKSSRHLDMVIKKGVGVEMFRLQNGERLNDIKHEETIERKETRNKERNSKRKYRDENKQKSIRPVRHEDLVRQAVSIINEHDDQVPKSSIKVADSKHDGDSKKSWMFKEERLLHGEKDEFDPHLKGHSQRNSTKFIGKEITNGTSKIRNGKHRDLDVENHVGFNEQGRSVSKQYRNQEPLYDTIPATDSAEELVKIISINSLHNNDIQIDSNHSKARNNLQRNGSPDFTDGEDFTLPPPPPELYGAAPRPVSPASTGFDLPLPFTEAVTDFRESPIYDTVIPTTQPQEAQEAKVLNPKIYKPIEIQSLKEQQTALRPNKSPTYMSGEQINYRIQKPVLLHPAPISRMASLRDAAHDSAQLPARNEPLNPSRLLTNEQIAGRQLEHVNIKKDVVDLGILIESRERRAIVSEVYEGGAIHKHGAIHVGDELMIMEQHLLIGMPIDKVYSLLKQEYKSPKPVMEIVVAKAPENARGVQILPRPDYVDLPVSNLDDFLAEDDVEICMYNNDVPVTII